MGQVRSLDNNGTTTEVVYLQGGEGEEDQLVYIEQPGLATNKISKIFFVFFLNFKFNFHLLSEGESLFREDTVFFRSGLRSLKGLFKEIRIDLMTIPRRQQLQLNSLPLQVGSSLSSPRPQKWPTLCRTDWLLTYPPTSWGLLPPPPPLDRGAFCQQPRHRISILFQVWQLTQLFCFLFEK